MDPKPPSIRTLFVHSSKRSYINYQVPSVDFTHQAVHHQHLSTRNISSCYSTSPRISMKKTRVLLSIFIRENAYVFLLLLAGLRISGKSYKPSIYLRRLFLICERKSPRSCSRTYTSMRRICLNIELNLSIKPLYPF